ncbi:MAG TPA: phosphotransferase family protein [Conexibacter sp.]|jgi:aminoglycoside phosphotransferase (APT) family kinase protein|nr:phosphotransferase family protein [Conexibacter sp.]
MTAAAADDVVRTHADARQSERPPLLVLEPLLAFLDEHGLGTGEPHVEPLGDGHSNVTLAVTRGATRLVLRRPPRPPWPPSAHDVLREARVLQALHGRARVPRVLAVCDDDAVIGAPFYVMERLDGHVLTSALPPALAPAAERRRVGEELVDALVELHAVDWRATGLERFGRPTGYLERQLHRFRGLWEHNRTRELPAVERVADWLAAHLPDSPEATLVHGDYRLGNALFAADAPARLAAVFDWELSTIGDPRADLGYLCALWVEPADPRIAFFEVGSVTRQAGFASRAELIDRYEEGTGRTMSDIEWYEALALWKAVVFMEGNYRRSLSGDDDDPFLAGFGEGVVELAERAEALTRGAR